MNAMTQSNGNTVVNVSDFNPFAAAAEAAGSGNRIVGELLKFKKGRWYKGQDDTPVAIGTELVANMHELMLGWLKWQDNKPVDMRMIRVMDGKAPADRASLGDTDQESWEIDENTNRPRDPWQKTNYLILKEIGGDALYTFAPSSSGGRGAVADLMGKYAKQWTMKPKDLPIVSLEARDYQHKDKKVGRVDVPILAIKGYTDSADFETALAADSAANDEGGENDPFKEPAPRADSLAAKSRAQKAAVKEEVEF